MPVISLISSKGGAGKTTAAVVLATTLADNGQSITLIDADPNQPIKDWADNAQLPAKLKIQSDIGESSIANGIEEASKHSNFVIVDVEGSGNAAAVMAASMSHLVLIPVQGSKLDMDQAIKTIRMIYAESQRSGRKISFALAFVRTSAAVRDSGLRDITEQVAKANIPCVPVELHERAAFRYIFSRGLSLRAISEADTRLSGLSQALENAQAFAAEVVRLSTTPPPSSEVKQSEEAA